jgi:DNA polymerase III sliding clamp (beta) subunit (PCNA family)
VSEDPFAGTEPPGGVNYGEFTFQAKRWVLGGLADVTAAALPANSDAVPCLGCYRVRAGEGFLELAATDMQRTIMASTGSVIAADRADGACHEALIPARKLQAILRELPDVDVRVAVSRNRALVTAGSGSWTLALPDGASYPELVNPGQLAFASYSRERLLAGLRAVRHVVSKDAGRPHLTQVDIRDDPDDGGHSVATASDGSRFARARLDHYPLPGVCIPSSALDDLARILAAGEPEDVGLSDTEEALLFRVGPVVLAVARRSTPFPDVDRLLLQPALENEDVLSVDRDELAAAVRRVRINADGETSAIVLEVAAGLVTAVARDKGGNSATESVPATWAGKERKLCVNHASLTEMLAAHPGKSCDLRLGKDAGKRRSMILLQGDGITQVIAQMSPSLVGY